MINYIKVLIKEYLYSSIFFAMCVVFVLIGLKFCAVILYFIGLLFVTKHRMDEKKSAKNRLAVLENDCDPEKYILLVKKRQMECSNLRKYVAVEFLKVNISSALLDLGKNKEALELIESVNTKKFNTITNCYYECELYKILNKNEFTNKALLLLEKIESNQYYKSLEIFKEFENNIKIEREFEIKNFDYIKNYYSHKIEKQVNKTKCYMMCTLLNIALEENDINEAKSYLNQMKAIGSKLKITAESERKIVNFGKYEQ